MVQNANGFQEVASDPNLAGEVRWVRDDLLCLGGELHGLTIVVAILHGCLDSRDLAALVV